MKFLIILILVIFYKKIDAVNILYVDEVLAPSHQIWNYIIVEELLNKGHNVTLIGPRTIKKPILHINYTWFELENIGKTVEETKLVDSDAAQSLNALQNINLFNDYIIYTCRDILKSKNLKTLLNYPKNFKFDLIIYDVSLGGCLYPLIQRFNFPPSIAVSVLLLPSHVSEFFGNTFNAAFTPHEFSEFTNKMNFIQRITNFILVNVHKVLLSIFSRDILNKEVKLYFGDDTKDLDELEKHFSLLLANIVPGLQYSRPLTPNIIPVGGLHIKPNKKLPLDIQDIFDKSKGVVLFSLGTFINTSELDPKRLEMILKQLGRLEETVLWKLSDELKNVPKNVIIRKWLPQNEILAHPKTKVFITHCGALSTMESVHYGVPIIGLPFFIDQNSNAVLLESQQLGKRLVFKTMTGKEFFNTIQEVLHNPKYTENAKKMSVLMNDQIERPLERAIFWIEWSIRNKGLNLFHPRSRDLSFFVKSNLDIYLFLIVIFLVALIIAISIIVFIFKFIICRNKSHKYKQS